MSDDPNRIPAAERPPRRVTDRVEGRGIRQVRNDRRRARRPIQALWSAAHYGVGVLFVVLANGRYAIMDKLAEQRGGKPPWPAFEEVSVAGLAESLGCPARVASPTTPGSWPPSTRSCSRCMSVPGPWCWR
jgi:hypothetical protein